MAFQRGRRSFRRPSFQRPRNTPHWLGFDATASLTTPATFTEVPIVDATAYEVNTAVSPSASLQVIVGAIVIVINASILTSEESIIGYWGFLCVDQDETVAVADHDLGANSLTDERWLKVGAYTVSNSAPCNIPFRVKQRALLRDKRVSFVMSFERVIDGAPTGVEANVMGRALLRI